MRVNIIPLCFAYGELRAAWRSAVRRDNLIPWAIARDYFRKPHAI